ncbi:hypothetical protein [Streptomyces sp. NPDC056192]
MEANAKLASANTLADIGGPALTGALIGVIGAGRAVAADAAPETLAASSSRTRTPISRSTTGS